MYASVLLGLLSQACLIRAQYALEKEYSGFGFFNAWSFYGNYDNLTNGDAYYISGATNTVAHLAYVNSAGNAIIKVDNTTVVPYNQKRNTVRITTQDQFAVDSVWVADMTHVPFGCSVWPAWWSQAPNWPIGGEIDTFEGVNQVTLNQMSLHTEPGCTQQNAVQSSTLINSTDCSYQSNNNQGCVVTAQTTQSYGAGFASVGGGVYITEFSANGISIWFFNRAQIPAALTNNASSIDTTTFGTPTANWPSTGCDVFNYFQPQHLIFDITLCGDFAGAVFSQTCSGSCYNDYVIGSPANYDNAYFEIRYVRVYGKGNTVEVPSSASRNRQTMSVPVIVAAVVGMSVIVGWFVI